MKILILLILASTPVLAYDSYYMPAVPSSNPYSYENYYRPSTPSLNHQIQERLRRSYEQQYQVDQYFLIEQYEEDRQQEYLDKVLKKEK